MPERVPGLADLRVLFIPLLCKMLPAVLAAASLGRQVNLPQASRHNLVIFPGNVFQRVAKYVNDA